MGRQRRRQSTGLFEVFQWQFAAEEAAKHPVVAPKPQPTAQELAAKRAQATTAAYEAEYRNRKAKENAESKIAQERGEVDFLLTHMGASKDEKRQLRNCPLAEVPTALSDLRNAKGSPEINALYDRVVLPSLLK
jgi:hypothetical protein